MSLLNSLLVLTAQTDNGAVTNESTLNSCLDLFFIAWSSRNMDESTIIQMFTHAYNEDSKTALKILFRARDIRSGAGERRFFRCIWKYICNQKQDIGNRLSKYIPEYGRWDDMFEYQSQITFDLIKQWLDKWDWLLAKWLPRKWKFANAVCSRLSLTPKQYRKLIVLLTKVVETQMCEKKRNQISYKNIPSVALNKYRNAWYRNDETRFTQYIEDVNNNKVTMNWEALYPYQVYRNFQEWNADLIQAQRNNLADYWWNWDILPVIDVSWSMYWWWSNIQPIEVSISLWVYLAEKIKWKFQDHFISFDWYPRLHKLSWNIIDKFNQVKKSWIDMSTNLQWVFDLLLKVAKRDWLKQDDMPSKLLVISDMEFNECWCDSNFNEIKRKYLESWYELPYIVFWNVNWRKWNNPSTSSEYVWMVSWASPSVIKWILSDNIKTPIDLMNEIVNSERYKVIE